MPVCINSCIKILYIHILYNIYIRGYAGRTAPGTVAANGGGTNGLKAAIFNKGHPVAAATAAGLG